MRRATRAGQRQKSSTILVFYHEFRFSETRIDSPSEFLISPAFANPAGPQAAEVPYTRPLRKK